MIYKAKIKTRRQMERTIPDRLRGWWWSCCQGQTLILRDATTDDLARCVVDPGALPEDYLCEVVDHGSLIHRMAVSHMTPLDTAAP
jgi:hypothetical protein